MEQVREFLDKLTDVKSKTDMNEHDLKTAFHRIDEIRHMFWTILVMQLAQSALFIWKTIGG